MYHKFIIYLKFYIFFKKFVMIDYYYLFFNYRINYIALILSVFTQDIGQIYKQIIYLQYFYYLNHFHNNFHYNFMEI